MYDPCTFTIFLIHISKYLYFVKMLLYREEMLFVYTLYCNILPIFSTKFVKQFQPIKMFTMTY